MTVQLILPYPPSANRLWVRARKGMRRSDEYEAWLTEAILKGRQQRPRPIEGPYKLAVHAVRPDKRARDLDNILKPISDALQKIGVIKNDSDCDMITARWVTFGQGVTVWLDPAGVE